FCVTLLYIMMRQPRRSLLFPYTTLFRSLPEDVRERLGQAFSQAVKDPETSKKLIDGGAFPVGNTPAEFSAQIKNEIARWKEVVRSEEHTSELQSRENLVCRLLLEKKKKR